MHETAEHLVRLQTTLGEFTIFGHVMLPLVRPALATVAVFQFVRLWNDFFFPLVLLGASRHEGPRIRALDGRVMQPRPTAARPLLCYAPGD
jgi:hypothetical protein